jgi:hypothetical protein
MKDLRITRPLQVDVNAAYPIAGKAKNVTSSGDGTGTPWIADVINDRSFGWQENVLKRAGIVANGLEEDSDNSQIAEAIERVSTVAAQGKNLAGSSRYGCTLTSEDDWVVDNSGAYWQWGGAFPKTVTAGETLSVGNGFLETPSADKESRLVSLEGKVGKSFADFGAVEGQDNTVAITAALESAKDGSVAIFEFSGKTYEYSSNITVVGTSLTIFTNCHLKGNSAHITLQGSPCTEIGHVSIAAPSGNNILSLSSVTGLQVGDTLVTTLDVNSSFSSHRVDYKDGEFLEVLEISGNTITVEKPTEVTYTGIVTDKVFKSNPLQLSITGGTFSSDSAAYALRLAHLSKGSVIAPCKVTTSQHIVGAMSIEKSVGVRVEGGSYYAPFTGGGFDYGVNIVNSQDVDVHNINSFGGRHPVTTGGDNVLPNPPCRRVRIHASTLFNDTQASVYAADFHGNSIDCAYINCNTVGGVGLAGVNPSYIGGKVYGHEGSNDIPLSWHELVGGVCEFKNVKVKNLLGLATEVAGITAGSLSDKIDNNYRVVVDGLDAEINSNVTSIISAYENSGKPNDWELRNFSTRGGLSLLTSAVKFTKGPTGRDATSIVVEAPEGSVPASFDWLTVANTILASCSIRLPTANGTTDLATDYLVDYQGEILHGSNSNGSFTKHSDGTMEQYHRITTTSDISAAFLGGFRTGIISWTFPEPFAAGTSPVITAVPEDASMFSVVESSKTNTEVSLLGTAITSQPSGTRTLSVTAKGRWK